MEGNLPSLDTDWDDFQVAIKKCPGKAFMIREPGWPLLEEEEEEEAAEAAS